VTEEGCRNKNDENYPELEVTVAALSGGPVGPSDRYNLFNRTLIMATWYIAVGMDDIMMLIVILQAY